MDKFEYYAYVVWDGLRFFTPEHHKLFEVHDNDLNWYNKLLSCTWLIPFTLILALTILIVYQ